MIVRALSAAVFLLFLTGSVRAELEQVQKLNVAGWDGGAYKTWEGVFSHCFIARAYNSGSSLGFGLTRWEEWQIVIGDDAWRQPEWTKYKAALFIDDHPLGVFSSMVRAPKFLLINLGVRPDLYQSLRRGHRLRVEAAEEVYVFGLEGTSQALAKVRECVDVFMALSPP